MIGAIPLTRKEGHQRYEARRPPRSNAYKIKRRAYQRANPERNLCNQARYRAKKSGIEFDITYKDIIVPTYCPYLDIILRQAQGTGPRYASPTLDRIDNSRGYVRGNIEVISYRANMLKRDLSLKEMELMGRALLERAWNNK